MLRSIPATRAAPLLNAEGRLIGINTAVYNGGQGIGFAIPIDIASRVVSELIAHGEVSPVWLGLEFQDLTPDLGQALALPEGTRGARCEPRARGQPGGAAPACARRRDDPARAPAGSPRAGLLRDARRARPPARSCALDLLRQGAAHRSRSVPRRFPTPWCRRSCASGSASSSPRPSRAATRSRGAQGRRRRAHRHPARRPAARHQRAPAPGRRSLRRSALDLSGRSRALVVVQRGNGRYHVTIPLA